jgi:Holliday junction resolvasome RuvABC ATP-dependent DNA helicase subunit
MTIKLDADDVFQRLRFLFDPQKLIILRGAPGSGKTTFANRLISRCPASLRMGRGIVHWENDMFFLKNGKYEWSKERLPDAIEWCNSNAIQSMMRGATVIVANTFIKHVHMAELINAADSLGIPHVVFRMTGKHKDINNVPKDIVENMRANMEDYEYEIQTPGFDSKDGLMLEIPNEYIP